MRVALFGAGRDGSLRAQTPGTGTVASSAPKALRIAEALTISARERRLVSLSEIAS